MVSDKGYLVGIATSIVSSKCGVGNIETYSNVYKFLDFINSVMDVSITWNNLLYDRKILIHCLIDYRVLTNRNLIEEDMKFAQSWS